MNKRQKKKWFTRMRQAKTFEITIKDGRLYLDKQGKRRVKILNIGERHKGKLSTYYFKYIYHKGE